MRDAHDREVDVPLPLSCPGMLVTTLKQRRDGQPGVTLQIVRRGRVIGTVTHPAPRQGRRGDTVEVLLEWTSPDALTVALRRGDVTIREIIALDPASS